MRRHMYPLPPQQAASVVSNRGRRRARSARRPRLGDLLARTASGELPARVHAVLPLDQVADAYRAVAKGGVRGRYVLKP